MDVEKQVPDDLHIGLVLGTMEEMRRYQSRLTRVLPPGFIPPGMKARIFFYESSLANVLRFSSMRSITGDFYETDLDHTVGFLERINLYERRHALQQNFDFTTLRWMGITHDSGEIEAGDLDNALALAQDPEVRDPHNQLESSVFYTYILSRIKENTLRDTIGNGYRRYSDRASDDKEALFAHLIDKILGNEIALVHYFDLEQLQLDPSDWERRVKLGTHQTKMLGKTFDNYFQLLKIVPPECVDDLERIAREHLQLYLQAGYGYEVAAFQEKHAMDLLTFD